MKKMVLNLQKNNFNKYCSFYNTTEKSVILNNVNKMKVSFIFHYK